jgi:hypothetical protein
MSPVTDGDPLTPLLTHYDACLREHGATAAGVDYGDPVAADIHYEVALGMVKRKSAPTRPSLLDFGCGWGSLLDYMLRTPRWFWKSEPMFDYTGLDILPSSIAAARKRFPGEDFLCSDIRTDGVPPRRWDYITACGVYPRATGVDKTELWDFLRESVSMLFDACDIGMSWNVLSSHVDYETDDWLHIPFDQMAEFVNTLTRRFVFRVDYAWPGYTVYAWR